LRLGMALGGLVLAFSLLLSMIAIANTMFHLKYFGVLGEAGHLGTLLAILFLGSVQLICMGLLGEYIGRIYDEVRRRPLYVVHKVYRPNTSMESMLVHKRDKMLAVVEDSAA